MKEDVVSVGGFQELMNECLVRFVWIEQEEVQRGRKLKCRAKKKVEGKYVTCNKETTKKSVNESITKFKEIFCPACLTNHIISGIIEATGDESVL